MIRELLLLLVLGAAVSEAVLCDATTCATFKCGLPRCPQDFIIKKRGGFCGCCDNCVPALKEGETCNPESLIGGYPYHNGVTNSDPMCGLGLKCSPDSKVCVKKVQKGKKNRTSTTPTPTTTTTNTPPQPTEPAGK